MNSKMKMAFFAVVFLVASVGTANAVCQVSTSCGDDFYIENCNSISVQESTTNGTTTVTIYVDGELYDQTTCSASSGGGGGGFDICDFIPWFC